ncbi:hypothetical protein [uncultured Ruminococcus sp.]|nr:hypothetical protein [uncultured Ruminococcus sp.]
MGRGAVSPPKMRSFARGWAAAELINARECRSAKRDMRADCAIDLKRKI